MTRVYCHQVDDENQAGTFPMPMIIAGKHLRVSYASCEELFSGRGMSIGGVMLHKMGVPAKGPLMDKGDEFFVDVFVRIAHGDWKIHF